MNDKVKQLITKMQSEKLTYLEIRELQFLIKENFEHADKQKYFGIINIYKIDKNNYLKIYLRNLLEKLRSI